MSTVLSSKDNTMKFKMFSAITVLVFLLLPHLGYTHSPIETVDYVDLDRYKGRWYEIALIPNHFQKKCLNNTVLNYSLLENGKISVVNQCDKEEGKLIAPAKAKVVDAETQASLKVTFAKLFGMPLWWFSLDYWIVGLADDYEWAIVSGSKNREKRAWIIAREKTLTEMQWGNIMSILKDKGYEAHNFLLYPQTNGYEEKSSLSEFLKNT